MSIPEYNILNAQKVFLDNINDELLLGAVCDNCGTIHTPPTGACTKCGQRSFSWKQLSGKGKIETYTAIFVGSPEFADEVNIVEQKGFVLGIVKLEEGSNVNARILGVDAKEAKSIKIGTPVTLTTFTTPSGKKLLAFKI